MTRNPNTSLFWNKKLKENKSKLSKSPIFLDKISIVSKKASRIKGNILDIGFGNGYLEKKIKEYGSDNHMFGIDISDYAVVQAKKNLEGTFIKGSILSIPFRSNFFDCVITLDVLEHLNGSQVYRALNEIHRVTRRNGVFLTSVPLNDSVVDAKMNLHLRKYTFDLLNFELKSAGFNIKWSKYLYAYSNQYELKSLIARLTNFFKPNLLIVLAQKT